MPNSVSRSRSAFLLVFLSLWFNSCSTLNPDAPPKVAEAPLPPTPLSTITMPVHIPVAPLAGQIDAVLSAASGPQGMYWVEGLDAGHGLRLRFGLHRNGNSSVTAENGCLLIAVPLEMNNGQADWEQDVLVGKLRHRMEFGGSVLVRARACFSVGADWKLRTTLAPDFSWTEGAWLDLNLPLGQFKIDISRYVEPKLREKLPAMQSALAEMAERIPIKPQLEQAWVQIQQPVELSQEPPLTLEMEPVSLGVSPPQSRGGELVVRPTIMARVRVFSGKGEAPAHPSPLPANSGSVGEGGFSLSARVDIGFDELNRLAQQHLLGKTFDLGEGRTLFLDAIRISPYGEQLLLKVRFKARLTRDATSGLAGWMYLLGKPRYDEAAQQLQVVDVDFDLDTQNKLIDGAEALMHGVFRQQLQAALVFDLAEEMGRMRKQVDDGLQRVKLAEGLRLDAELDTLAVSGIHIGREAVAIFSTATGRSSLRVSLPQR